METQLRTEPGELLRHDVDDGAFRSVEHAVSLLQAQATWVPERRAEKPNNSNKIGLLVRR